jgi:hypothetical protein
MSIIKPCDIPHPETFQDTMELVNKTVNELTQLLTIYSVIAAVLLFVIGYFLFKLIAVIVRYKRRDIATRKTAEDKAMARSGSISLLNNAKTDNEVYDKDPEAIAENMDDFKKYTENIKRKMDAVNIAELKNQDHEEPVDKTAIHRQFDNN